jgi:hypothetical protein
MKTQMACGAELALIPPDWLDLAPGPRLVLPLLPEGNEWLKE